LGVGAETPIPSSCGDLVLVNEPAVVEGAMRPMSVVVPEINPQHLLQVTSADDQ
jgi:hypothetical protein